VAAVVARPGRSVEWQRERLLGSREDATSLRGGGEYPAYYSYGYPLYYSYSFYARSLIIVTTTHGGITTVISHSGLYLAAHLHEHRDPMCAELPKLL
jgi:hypothetical protein